ncbi:MAG: hypothetical protein A2900_05025 [Candidatus Chisholmbacteria bacterium RIFCSPLOWO2_01_FULL_50_28]|uniref:SGNH hydrolase-type esterase domain-containing protein n=1 Tax=Candidatus Chisholmbacteria bacterium RIFCSPHIGHO2_01_FULL_52_32 TaxID=1797591 RepID=A0A1G1VS26_9BACT|nr:MAG: hypothetical protein A2786_01715 [Candidatus Chisholmbacteria bacterium RIFCSPHIGHO2_01_FULL_52_32]OGY20411.1 MAG: hypothetical protein A2900_05025 [Candidatus Chisholmbacteria bacterium RIFCSPLOWO2_01_FULL_50_28]
MNICVFGDSITWGAFLPFRGAWANLLRNYLETINPFIALYDLGVDKDTSEEVLKRFEPEAESRKPDLIIFAVGINDSAYRKTKDNPVVPLSQFENNINKLIETAKKMTESIFFVGLVKGDDSKTLPLPRSTTGKCYGKDNVRKYNTILQKVCTKHRITYLDIFQLLTDEDFDDGLHPNLGGHQKIFEAVRRSLLKSGLLTS